MNIETIRHIRTIDVSNFTEEQKMDFIISALRYLALQVENIQTNAKRK